MPMQITVEIKTRMASMNGPDRSFASFAYLHTKGSDYALIYSLPVVGESMATRTLLNRDAIRHQITDCTNDTMGLKVKAQTHKAGRSLVKDNSEHVVGVELKIEPIPHCIQLCLLERERFVQSQRYR